MIAPQTEWGVDRSFKEMAAEIFSGSRWTQLVARGWRNTSEDFLAYESRALLRAVEIQFSLSPQEGEHAVAMSDNLPAVVFREEKSKTCCGPFLHTSGCRPLPRPEQALTRKMGPERAQPERRGF